MARFALVRRWILASVGLVACARGPTPSSRPSARSPEPAAARQTTEGVAPGSAELQPGEPTPEPDAKPDPKPPPRCWGATEDARVRHFIPLIERMADKHGLDPDLVGGLVWVESKFRPRARGPGGSRGLMQLMPRTSRAIARRIRRPHRPHDPEFNVDAGSYYLARMLRRFEDERLAIAGYNRGPGRIRAWAASPEGFPEAIEAYVERVLEAKACFARFRALDPPTE